MKIHPYFRKIKTSRGFTVMELLAVVIVVGVIFVVLAPALLNDHEHHPIRINCVNNLKQVGLAFRLWAGDNNEIYPTRFYTNNSGGPAFADASNVFLYFQVMSNELGTPKVVVCPADTERSPATNFSDSFNNRNVSYFIGLDTDETRPQMLLSGDRNLTNGAPLNNGLMTLATNQPMGWTAQIHQGQGNIAFADGSVQEISSSNLKAVVANTGVATNRLVIP